MTPRLLSDEIQSWANRLTRYLDSIRSLLQFKTADAKAGQDGVILLQRCAAALAERRRAKRCRPLLTAPFFLTKL